MAYQEGRLTTVPTGSAPFRPKAALRTRSVLSTSSDRTRRRFSPPRSGWSTRSPDVYFVLNIDSAAAPNFFLVAPGDRESEVRAQLVKPAFSRIAELNLRYLSHSGLPDHHDAIAPFRDGIKGILTIARLIRSDISALPLADGLE